MVTPEVRNSVMWAFRFEDQEGVRAEACHSLTNLKLKDPEVVHALQERYLVETSEIVRKCARTLNLVLICICRSHLSVSIIVLGSFSWR